MNFFERHWKTFILFFVGPVLGSFFAYYYFQIRPVPESTMAPPDIGVGLAISLAITFIGSSLGFQITITEVSDDLNKKIESTKDEFLKIQGEMLDGHARVSEIKGKDINKVVLEKIRSAVTVRNTYVNLAERMQKIPGAEEASIAHYKEFLSCDERHWIDITTVQDMSLGRFERIDPSVMGQGSRHDISIVYSSTDIINFVLLEYEGGKADLLFGWGGENGDYFRVLCTDDLAMLDLFQGYFNSLQSASVEDICVKFGDNPIYKSQADKLIGRWVCIPRIERMTRSNMFKTYAILRISIKGGAWSIKSEIFNSANDQRIRVIESEMAMYHTGSVFFEGISRSVGGINRLTTFGQFKIAPDYDDMIIGTYLSEDAKMVSRLFACRLSDDLDPVRFSSLTPTIEKIISRKDIVRADDWDI